MCMLGPGRVRSSEGVGSLVLSKRVATTCRCCRGCSIAVLGWGSVLVGGYLLAGLMGAQQRESKAQPTLFPERSDLEGVEGDDDVDVGFVAHFDYYNPSRH